MSKFKPGDRVRATSSWTGRSCGKGTVVTTNDSGGNGVALDRNKQDGPAHFYDSELTKVNEKR